MSRLAQDKWTFRADPTLTNWRVVHNTDALTARCGCLWFGCVYKTMRRSSQQATRSPGETEATVRSVAFRECVCRPDARSTRPKSRKRAQLGSASCIRARTCRNRKPQTSKSELLPTSQARGTKRRVTRGRASLCSVSICTRVLVRHCEHHTERKALRQHTRQRPWLHQPEHRRHRCDHGPESSEDSGDVTSAAHRHAGRRLCEHAGTSSCSPSRTENSRNDSDSASTQRQVRAVQSYRGEM